LQYLFLGTIATVSKIECMSLWGFSVGQLKSFIAWKLVSNIRVSTTNAYIIFLYKKEKENKHKPN